MTTNIPKVTWVNSDFLRIHWKLPSRINMINGSGTFGE